MKYLTKQWYELSQLTDLHFNMKVLSDAKRYDESLYINLYKLSEENYLVEQRESHNLDPRFMLEEEGSTFISLDKFVNGEELLEEDVLVYEMPPEVKENIQNLIEEFDLRPQFDEKECRENFKSKQETIEKENKKRIPNEIYNQIADPRVFALGYCTKEIYNQLETLSKDSFEKMESVLKEYSLSQQDERISHNIRKQFGFHDSKVKDFVVDGEDIKIEFDNQHGFSEFKRMIFESAKITHQEGSIQGSFWIYEELYLSSGGYEVHILFSGDSLQEIIITCRNIVIYEN